jgi:hypothetical protein
LKRASRGGKVSPGLASEAENESLELLLVVALELARNVVGGDLSVGAVAEARDRRVDGGGDALIRDVAGLAALRRTVR